MGLRRGQWILVVCFAAVSGCTSVGTRDAEETIASVRDTAVVSEVLGPAGPATRESSALPTTDSIPTGRVGNVDPEPVAVSQETDVLVEIEVASSVVLAGSSFRARLLINNQSDESIEILDQSCAPNWRCALSGDVETHSGGFRAICGLAPFIVPVGVSSHLIDVAATYGPCQRDGSGDDNVPTCEGSSTVARSLPAGDYEVVLVGSLPGLSPPEPIPVRVVDRLNATDSDELGDAVEPDGSPPPTDGLLPRSASVASGLVYLDGGLVYTDLAGQVLRTVDVPAAVPGFAQLLYVAGSEVYIGAGLQVHAVSGQSLATIEVGKMLGPVEPDGYWRLDQLTPPEEAVWSFATFNGRATKTLTLSLSEVVFGSYGNGVVTFVRNSGQTEYAAPGADTVVGLGLMELAAGTWTTVAIDRGVGVAWIDDQQVVLFADTNAFILDVDTGETTELATRTSQLEVLWPAPTE